MQIGAAARPHPRKKAPPNFSGPFIGEDAFFAFNSSRGWAVLGVADGVSGAGKIQLTGRFPYSDDHVSAFQSALS